MNQDQKHIDTEELMPPIKRKSKLKGIIKWSFGVMMLILFLLIGLIHYPPFQQWAAQKATIFLSNKLETTVRLEKLKFGLLGGMDMTNFYVEDLKGDTLLSADNLYVDLAFGLYTLLGNSIYIEDVGLTHAQFNLKRAAWQPLNNLDELLQKLSTPSNKPSKQAPTSTFFIDLEQITLNQVKFLKEDSVVGQDLDIYVHQGKIMIEDLNLDQKKLAVASVYIQQPIVNILEYPTYPPIFMVDTISENAHLNVENDTTVFVANIGKVNLEAAQFSLTNLRNAPIKLTSDDILDYDHLKVHDINIAIENFFYSEWEFKGRAKHLSAKTSTGFVLERLSAEEAIVNCQRMILNDLIIKTPDSEIGDSLTFKYKQYTDWEEFVDKIRLDAKIKDSKVALKDIMTFAPNLNNNVFFRNNQNRVFQLNGAVKGRINRLNGDGIDIRLADKLRFQGNFGSRNLSLTDEAILNLEVKRLQTDMVTLRQLIPGFNPPRNFDKLTRLDFTGRFDGFFVDWVTKGNLKTNLGNAYTDINLNVVNGRANAEYSGQISLFDFDLGKWSDNTDFGKVTFNASVQEGKGLELSTANAKLTARIDSLEIRNYDYRNVNINGQLNREFFNGDLTINDPNIDLDFRGAIDFTNLTPRFDFSADIKKLALKPLNLSKEDFAFGGEVDIRLLNTDFSDIRGDAAVYDLTITHNQEKTYQIDSVILHSKVDERGVKDFAIESNILTTSFVGDFDIEEIPLAFYQVFARNYPEFAERLSYKPKQKDLDSAKFNFNIKVIDTENLTELIDHKLDRLRNLTAFGHFDSYIDSIHFDIEIDSFQYDNLKFIDVVSINKISGNESDLQIGIRNFLVNGKSVLQRFVSVSYVDANSVEFGLYLINMNQLIDDLNIEGVLTLEPNNDYKITFMNSDIAILNEKWTINEQNFLRFGRGLVQTEDFVLTNGDKEIILNSKGERGLELTLENLDLGLINEYWIYESLDFQGLVNLKASADNIYQLQDLEATLEIDTLFINNDDWGRFRLDAATPKLEHSIAANFTLTQPNDFQVIGEGFYNPPTFIPTKGKPFPKNYFDLNLNLTEFPVRFLEYILEGSINNTVGTIEGSARFHGTPDNIDLEGSVDGKYVATSLDFMKTRYFLDEGTVNITSQKFDATGIKVRDELGNYATVTGGLVHDHLKNMGLDVVIETDGSQFLAMNTQKEDNSVLYGRGLGTGRLKFTGLFAQTEAEITATTTAGTNIHIPISSEETTAENSFIIFKTPKENPKGAEDNPEITGLNLNLNLTLTQDAEVELIFDEKWGDVIRGNGDGSLQIFMGREGDLEMRGTYIINQGNYLFTLGLVNKPFLVEKGGRITWDGDPYNAEIKINALYDGLSANVYNFIQEFISTASQDVIDASRNTTPINLGMQLTGELFKPDINFDISFPTVAPELKSYTDSKLRILQQDQNELNRQVFGLLVSGQFLPTGGGIPYADIPINTISEMIANQLSIYVTELLSEWLTENGIISGIDIDLNLSRYSADNVNNIGEYNQTGNEFQGRLKLLFKDDRLIFHAGGNFDWGNTTSLSTVPTNSAQFGQEFMLEYVLTEDRKFRVRLYQRTEPDLNGRRLKIGGGLSFRKEFDHFSELFENNK